MNTLELNFLTTDEGGLLEIVPYVFFRMPAKASKGPTAKGEILCPFWIEISEPDVVFQPNRSHNQNVTDWRLLPETTFRLNDGREAKMRVAVCERIPNGHILSYKRLDGKTLWTMVPSDPYAYTPLEW